VFAHLLLDFIRMSSLFGVQQLLRMQHHQVGKPVFRLAWNKQDAHLICSTSSDTYACVDLLPHEPALIIDSRVPSQGCL